MNANLCAHGMENGISMFSWPESIFKVPQYTSSVGYLKKKKNSSKYLKCGAMILMQLFQNKQPSISRFNPQPVCPYRNPLLFKLELELTQHYPFKPFPLTPPRNSHVLPLVAQTAVPRASSCEKRRVEKYQFETKFASGMVDDESRRCAFLNQMTGLLTAYSELCLETRNS
mmetsp:Transcript_17379/g.29700  ORF Transcript_17379/g.29700 Transcript_17379/m.29700 type:complete len:171 (+) Transcript_17379:1743-2255(+)